MGIQKNFVVKNGLEVGTNLIFAQDGQVGIGSTIPEATFDVTGSLNADFATNASLNVTGVATILDGEATLWEVLGSDGQSGFSTFWSQNVVGFSSIQELRVVGISTFEDQVRIVGITTIVNNNLHVGAGGTVFHTSTAGFVGINTDSPEYLLDVRSSGTGVTALYVKGDVTITGDLKVDDLQFDDLDAQDANIVGFVTVGGGAASLGGQTHLHVIGISSMQNLRVVGFTTLGSGGSDEDGQTHLHVIGITSTKNLDVTGFGTVHNQFRTRTAISTDLNVTGVGTIQELRVTGFTTVQENLNIQGITSTGNLNVVGQTTSYNFEASGFVTAFNQLRSRSAVSTDLYVSGVGTIQELRVTGFTTVQENLNIQGITSTGNLNIVGQTTSYNIEASGFGTVFNQFRSRSSISTDLHVSGVGTINELRVTGFSTVQDDIHILGITSTKNLDVTGFGTVHNQLRSRTAISTDLNVTGVGTIQELRVTGFSTVQENLNVQGITSTGNLNIVGQTTSYNIEASGFGTVFNQFRARSGVFTDTYTSGLSTVGSKLHVGVSGTAFRAEVDGVTGLGSIGINTDNAQYSLHVASASTEGTVVAYIEGDLQVSGDIIADDITLDDVILQDVNITGFTTIGHNLNVLGITSVGNLNTVGYTTTKNLDVTGFATVFNKFEATSGIFTDINVTGMSTFFNVGFGSTVGFTSSVFFADGAVLNFGNANDLIIYHDGSDSYIKDVGTGAINIHGSPASFIGNSSGDTLLKAVEGGGVELYFNNAILAETTAEGFTMHGVGVATHLSITGIATVGVSQSVFFNEGGLRADGIVTATSYRGDGSHLTGIETSISTSARWNSTDAGINTSRNVGIATTNPLNTVQVGAALSSFTVISLGSTVMVGVGTTDPGKTLQVIGDTDIEGVLTLNGSSVPTVGLVIALGG